MLLDHQLVKKTINDYNIDITGIFHIGSHECEELPIYYNLFGVTSENIVWIDAITEKVEQMRQQGIPNVYHALITDRDDDFVDFHIANNGESSSILDFGLHKEHYPHVHFVDTIKQKTMTIDTFFKKAELNPEKYVLWNLDIQGAELLALKGATEAIKHVKIMYLEVNVDEMYKGCARLTEIDDFLGAHGFKRVLDCVGDGSWGDAIYVRS